MIQDLFSACFEVFYYTHHSSNFPFAHPHPSTAKALVFRRQGAFTDFVIGIFFS